MTLSIKSKFPGQKTSPTKQFEDIAKHNSDINLSGEYPGISCHPNLNTYLNNSLLENAHLLEFPCGMPGLQKNIAEVIQALYGYTCIADKCITITSGATNAINATISAFVHEGDEVIVLEPSKQAYKPQIELNGGIPVFVSLKEKDFNVDWDQVQKAINGKTRMIIVNTPHNPTGKVFSAWDFTQLQKMVAGTDIIILSDEAQNPMVFPGTELSSILMYPKLMQRSVVINSFSKILSIPGWRVGYCIAPNNLTTEIRKVHECLSLSAHVGAQKALQHFIENDFSASAIQQQFNELREICISKLEKTAFKVIVPEGGHYLLIDYSAISAEKASDFAYSLIDQIKIALMPISVFYKNQTKQPLLRLNFAQPRDLLIQALDRLVTYNELKCKMEISG
jgi:methionine aminotransferase